MYVRDANGRVYVVAETRLDSLPHATKKGKGGTRTLSDGWIIVKSVTGSDLAGLKYEPIFDWYRSKVSNDAYKVCCDEYVKDDSGTGVVHQAPAYGEDDYRVCIANSVIQRDEPLADPVDANGCFVAPAPEDLCGVYIKNADKFLIQLVKDKGRLIDNGRIVHSYPFCWRSQTPLIYRAVASFFVNVEAIKDRLMSNNLQTSWVPSYVKEKRFHNWLENAHDWAISRNRYWGTPIPIWQSPSGDESIVVGSIAELESLTGHPVTDLHRHFIDQLEIPSPRGPGFPSLRRVEDVFDCWFESGSMPYAQQHYPFENKKRFEDAFPADFVAEGLDQTRGWFYTLMVLSTALFDKPAFKNLICNGLVLASDGKKMSKSLKNYPDPHEILDKYGADALRLYLIDSPVVRAEPLRFKEEGVFSVLKDVFLPWYNAYRFMVQNIKRLEESCGEFRPVQGESLSENVLDIWITSLTNSLVRFVRDEMRSYRLYTVVPRLLSFISQLTNIYVRYNRSRIKGKLGDNESRTSLNVLFNVLLTLGKTMAPFTPFFVENMYQNMRRCLDDPEESIHFCDFPSFTEGSSPRIEQSVSKMQSVIETVRAVRERCGKPLKMPIMSMTIVDSDAQFLSDAQDTLLPYIKDELNVRDVHVSCDLGQYASLQADPNFASLGKRLGKSMKEVTKHIRDWKPEDISAFQSTGTATVAGHLLDQNDVIVKYVFKNKDDSDTAYATVDEAGSMVILDLRRDTSLLYSGAARLLVNRIQKLRKSAGLQTSDKIEVLYQTRDNRHESDGVEQMLSIEKDSIFEAIGTVPRREHDGKHVLYGSDVFEILPDVCIEIFVVRPHITAADVKIAVESMQVSDESVAALLSAHEFDLLQLALDQAEGLYLSIDDNDIRLTH